jgi:Winged helix-turn helix
MSYGEMQQWLAQTCQGTVEYGTLYRVVRYELKAKPKVPRPRALSQDPEKLNAFQKNCSDAQRAATLRQTKAAKIASLTPYDFRLEALLGAVSY